MRILALDVGSSSIKAGYFKNAHPKTLARIPITATRNGACVEVSLTGKTGMLAALEAAITHAMEGHTKLDAIVLDTFCPALVLLDKSNKPLAGAVTHQDRRSIAQATEIEHRIGKARHLAITGNRPFPGGIASTSLLWFMQNEKALAKRIAKVGQLSSYLIQHLTGEWVIDPSQAAFLGLYDSVKLTGWSEEICSALHVNPAWLPRVAFADEIAGTSSSTSIGCVFPTRATAVTRAGISSISHCTISKLCGH